MTFLKDLYAAFVIFASNINARYGVLINVVLIVAVLGVLGVTLARTVSLGRTYRKRQPLKLPKPDPLLTERAAESLSQAIRIPTVTGDEAQMEAMIDWLKTRYADALSRLHCQFLAGGSLLLRWKPAEKSKLKPVMFCAHLDVVPPGEGWSGEPFSGQRKDGYIHGRGAIDCKNVVVALLEALTALMNEGFSPKREVYFSFGVDEETGGEQGAESISKMLSKQGISFEMILDEGGYISKAHLGSKLFPAALIGVGEKANVNVRLTAGSRGGHASMPPAHTALGYLAEAICRLEAAPPRGRILPVVRQFLRMSAPAMTFGQRFAVSNLPFSRGVLLRIFRGNPQVNALLRSTFSATQASASPVPNVLPRTAEAMINVRLLQGDTAQSMVHYIKALLADLPVQVELVRDSEPSPVASTDSPLYLALCSAIEEKFYHMPCIPTILTSGTDASHYVGLSDNILRFMPFVISGKAFSAMHGANEYVRESSLGTAVEVYMGLMRKL